MLDYDVVIDGVLFEAGTVYIGDDGMMYSIFSNIPLCAA